MTTSKLGLPEEFPCPICGELRDVGITKKGKPYFQCTPCGVQVFIRGKPGINRLCDIQNNSKLRGKLELLEIFDSCKLLQFRQRISLIEQEIARIDAKGFSFELSQAEKQNKSHLLAKLEALENEYTALLRNEKPLSKDGKQV